MSSQPTKGVESQPQATLCSGGCGFFANVGTSGLCSKCHREAEAAKQNADAVTAAVVQRGQAAAAAPAAAMPAPAEAATPAQAAEAPAVSSLVEAAATPAAAAAASAEASSPPPPPSNPNKCNVDACRKKLGLTGFKCRCGHSFCGQHRHAEGHNCTFDWKALGRLKIADNNPLVQASKIQKI